MRHHLVVNWCKLTLLIPGLQVHIVGTLCHGLDPPQQQGSTSSYCQKENGSSPWSDQCSLKTLEPSRRIPTYTMEYLKDPKTVNISQWLETWDTRNLYLCPCQSLQKMSTMTGQKKRHDAKKGCLEPLTNNNSFSAGGLASTAGDISKGSRHDRCPAQGLL